MSVQKTVQMKELGIVEIYGPLGRVENPSFEEGDTSPTGWSLEGNISWISEGARIGTKALYTKGGAFKSSSSVFDIVPGKKYTSEIYVKGVLSAGKVAVSIVWYKYWGWEEVGRTSFIITEGNYEDWTRFWTEGVAPAEATTANLVIETIEPISGELFLDDAQIYTEPYTIYVIALDAVGLPLTIMPNRVENNAHACVYLYRVPRLKPLTLNITFYVTETSKVDVYDPELKRQIMEARYIDVPTTFTVTWDGQGKLEPRVMEGNVERIEISTTERLPKNYEPVAPNTYALFFILLTLGLSIASIITFIWKGRKIG